MAYWFLPVMTTYTANRASIIRTSASVSDGSRASCRSRAPSSGVWLLGTLGFEGFGIAFTVTALQPAERQETGPDGDGHRPSRSRILAGSG
jgi:hypothetical protein